MHSVRPRVALFTIGLLLLLVSPLIAADAPAARRLPTDVRTNLYCDPWQPYCSNTVVNYDQLPEDPCGGGSINDYCTYYPYSDSNCCIYREVNCWYWEEVTQSYRPWYHYYGYEFQCNH